MRHGRKQEDERKEGRKEGRWRGRRGEEKVRR
jgi:hypothetical protein